MSKNTAGIVSATILISTACLTGGCATKPGPDRLADDGLQRVETALLDELYVAPNVSLANYQRVMLDPIEVDFKNGWLMRSPRRSGTRRAVMPPWRRPYAARRPSGVGVLA